jgi:hypothetical protein
MKARRIAIMDVDAVNRCTPGSFIELGFDRPLPPRGKGRGPKRDP